MHDPKTVAFEIRSPFKQRSRFFPEGYHEPIITIWHNDPEKGGDDDSCGWAFVNLSKEDCEWAEKRAKEEWPFWFDKKYESINFRQVSELPILSTVWVEARFQAAKIMRNKPLTTWDMAQICRLMTCPGDNFGHLVRRAKKNDEGLEELFALTLKCYRTARRPWWKRPRWHVHHWSFQIHPLQKFNRWAFSRCSRCGKRFHWGESPVSGSWHGSGPRFLKGEQNVWHIKCDAKAA